jgi:hypothetical protein
VFAGDLSFSVALYTITAILGITLLMARRYLVPIPSISISKTVFRNDFLSYIYLCTKFNSKQSSNNLSDKIGQN